MHKPHRWSSSDIQSVQRRCLAVIAHRRAGHAQSRRVFETGKVAHHCLAAGHLAADEIGRPLEPVETREVVDKAAKATAGGFLFEGHPEPPPRPNAIVEGQSLALGWMIDKQPPAPGWNPERSIYLNRNGEVVHKADAWLRVILDATGIDETEAGPVLVPRDWKTAWPADRRELQSVQRKCQAIAAVAMAIEDGVEFVGVRPEIVNLRRRRCYDDLVIDFENLGVVDEWRREIQIVTDGYDDKLAEDDSVEALASPGACCWECPHFGHCQPARKFWEMPATDDLGGVDVNELARSYLAHRAEARRLEGALRAWCLVEGAVVVDKTEVGFFEEESRKLPRGASASVWDAWRDYGLRQSGQEALVGEMRVHRERDLLASFLSALRIGSDGLDSLLQGLWPINKGAREERAAKKALREVLVERLVEVELKPKFKARAAPDNLEELLRASIAQHQEREDGE